MKNLVRVGGTARIPTTSGPWAIWIRRREAVEGGTRPRARSAADDKRSLPLEENAAYHYKLDIMIRRGDDAQHGEGGNVGTISKRCAANG